MMNNLENELKRVLEGEVRSDAATCCAYSVDASIYEVPPLLVVTPKEKEDIRKTVLIAAAHKVPVIARGAGTGITGGCLGNGIILDLSRHMNSVLEINIEQEYVVCQPGVVQDKLNALLQPYKYRLGPDTSTGNRATIGGMLANNAAGAHSLHYGKMVDHVLEVEIVLANGTFANLKELAEDQIDTLAKTSTQLGSICKEVNQIRAKYKEDIIQRFPKIPRRVSGYNLDELVKPGPTNLSKLIAGSEGTLGIATEIKLKISPVLNKTGLCVVQCSQMNDGLKAIMQMLSFRPISLEMLDSHILDAAKHTSTAKGKLDWVKGSPQAIFIAEFQEPHLTEKLEKFKQEMSKTGIGYACDILSGLQQQQQVWDVRKAGLGLLLSKRTYTRAIAFLEDLSVPPERLATFISDFKNYLANRGKEAGIYGHVGAGCMHIRPYIDLRKPEELRLMHGMMRDISSMVLENGGALSGEHGDGLIRTWLNEKMFGSTLYQAFCEIKAAFDPDNLLNPGKIVHGPALEQNLRLSPDTTIRRIATFQDFSPEGGFSLAADLCNGNGLCRKTEGLMCPSFQATGDEFDTTRARAQALRAVINGRWKIEDFTSKKVGSVLDLCLECKGCKSECPSSVDMAKMKAEFLYQHQERYGYSLRSKLFSNIGKLYRFGQPVAGLFNYIAESSLSKNILEKLGVARERNLPPLAKESFSSWLKKQMPQNVKHESKQVVLFNDTFMEFNEPENGIAAFRLLSLLGYEVIVPPWTCCCRPYISKGLLKESRKGMENLINALHPYASQQISIIGLEPSCILTIQDDLASVVSPEQQIQAKEVAMHCTTLDQFLHMHIKEGRLPLPFGKLAETVSLHGHCHQKALVGMAPTLAVLRSVPGLTVKEISSGCCGMAGSFGYEKEHYELSMKIGSLHLFPAVNSEPADTIIIANGFSCRHQIEHGTNKKAQHLAKALLSFCDSPK